jgi:hypothetical protein
MTGVFRSGDRIVAMLDLDKVLTLEGDMDKGAAGPS